MLKSAPSNLLWRHSESFVPRACETGLIGTFRNDARFDPRALTVQILRQWWWVAWLPRCVSAAIGLPMLPGGTRRRSLAR